MNKKIFSRGIFIENLRRARLFCIIMAVLTVVFETAPVLINVMELVREDAKTVVSIGSASFFMWVVALAAPVFLTMLLFAQFNKRAYSDFAHALPYTRKCIFFTNTVTAYVLFTLLLLLAAFAGIAGYAMFPSRFVINLAGFWKWILIFFSAGAFIISAFQIAAALTGTVVSNITAAGLLLFFPRYILFIMTYAITSAVPFFTSSYPLPLLSPNYNTLVGIMFSFGSSVLYGKASKISTAAIIYTLCAALVYTVAALVIFSKRKSETAENPAPGKKIQAAIRILVALVFAVPATALIAVGEGRNSLELVIILYALALVAYFAYEAITSHSVRNLAKAVPALLVVLLANLVCVGMIQGISETAGSYAPALGEIDAVCIENSSWKPDNSVYPNAEDVELRDASAKGIVSEALKANVKAWKDGNYNRFYNDRYISQNVTIIKNGFKHYRLVYFSEEQIENLHDAMSNNEDYQNAYMHLPGAIPGTLSVDGFDSKILPEEKIIKSVEKEIGKLGFKKWYTAFQTGNFEEFSAGSIYMRYAPKGYENATVSIQICPAYFPETYNILFSEAFKNQDIAKLLTMTELPEKAQNEAENDGRELSEYYMSCLVYFKGNSYRYDFSYMPGITATEKYAADESGFEYRIENGIDKEAASSETTEHENTVSKDVKKLLTDAVKDGSCPTSEGYICVDITISYYNEVRDGYDGDGGSFYLPVPEDFTPDAVPSLWAEY